MIKTSSEILIYACRYALGRMSGAPVDVIDCIRRNIDYIEVKHLCVIAADIMIFIIKNKGNESMYVGSWARLAYEIYQKLAPCSKEWLHNMNGGAVSDYLLFGVFDKYGFTKETESATIVA